MNINKDLPPIDKLFITGTRSPKPMLTRIVGPESTHIPRFPHMPKLQVCYLLTSGFSVPDQPAYTEWEDVPYVVDDGAFPASMSRLG